MAIVDNAIVVTPVDSGPVRVLARLSDGQPPPELCQYSPDGKTIYCNTHDARGRALFYAVPASGQGARVIVTFPDLARPSYRRDFGVDAKQFYFVIQDRQGNVWIADVAQ